MVPAGAGSGRAGRGTATASGASGRGHVEGGLVNDDTWVWIAVAVAVLALLALLAWFLGRRRREQQQTAQLRDRFGDEYDRRVERTGNEHEARRHLSEVAERREQLEIRPLAPAARDRYLQRWQVVQGDFVDRPGQAVDDADTIVNEVMRERGYPVDDFETRAADLSVDHSDVVENYRAAHGIAVAHERGSASTDDLRVAVKHYRALFEELVESRDQEEAKA